MTNKTVVNEAKAIAEQSAGALFVLDGCFPPMNNMKAANGVRTIAATRFYPDLAQWQILDPGDKYRELYNRYCNVEIYLQEDETAFSLIADDSIHIDLRYADLLRLGVTHVLSHHALGEVEDPDVSFIKIYDAELDPDIYRVTARAR